jgi:hypothetical protein
MELVQKKKRYEPPTYLLELSEKDYETLKELMADAHEANKGAVDEWDLRRPKLTFAFTFLDQAKWIES